MMRRKKRYLSVRIQLFVTYVVCALVPVFLILLLVLGRNLSEVDRDYQLALERSDRQIGLNIEKVLSNAEMTCYLHVIDENMLRVLRNRHDSYDKAYLEDSNTINAALRNAVKLDTNIWGAVLKTSQGVLYEYSYVAEYDTSIRNKIDDWGRLAEQGKYKRHFEFQFDEKGELKELFLIKPMIDVERHGENLGYICMRLDAKGIRDIFKDVEEDDGRVLLYDGQNRAFYRTGAMEGEDALEEKLGECAAMASEENPIVFTDFAAEGKRYICCIYYIGKLDWKVVSCVERAVVRRPYYNTLIFYMLVIFLMALFNIIMGRIFARKQTELIRRLCEVMDASTGDNLNTLVVPEWGFDSEIKKMARSYNAMTQRLRESMKQMYQTEMNERRMEIRMLQAQINPHFLYNCLNLISSIANFHDIGEIRTVAESMAELFRYSIKSGPVVRLSEELHQIENYIRIQRIRFPDKVFFGMDLEEGMEELLVPAFLLQPLVENAVMHGIEPKDGPGTLDLFGYREGDDVQITIKDTGVGMTWERLEELRAELRETKIQRISVKKQNSIGVKNVHQRIVAYYGAGYGLTIESTEGAGTVVSVHLSGEPAEYGTLFEPEV